MDPNGAVTWDGTYEERKIFRDSPLREGLK